MEIALTTVKNIRIELWKGTNRRELTRYILIKN